MSLYVARFGTFEPIQVAAKVAKRNEAVLFCDHCRPSSLNADGCRPYTAWRTFHICLPFPKLIPLPWTTVLSSHDQPHNHPSAVEQATRTV